MPQPRPARQFQAPPLSGKNMTTPLQPPEPEDTLQQWPRTVAEAVALLFQILSQAEKDEIAAKAEDDLIDLHFGLGTHVRNEFGLWQGNRALLADCQRARFEGRAGFPEIPHGVLVIHPDDAAMEIVRALWARLRH